LTAQQPVGQVSAGVVELAPGQLRLRAWEED